MKKIAIIGAGISGLFIANLFKKNSNYQVSIYEKNRSINTEEGYGIQLSVNSVKLLNKIAFNKAQADKKFFPEKINFYSNDSSKKICDLNISDFNFDDCKYTTLKRSILIDFLKKDLGDSIKTNFDISKISHQNEQIKLSFKNNKNTECDYLIISDGVFSRSKKLILNTQTEPKYNGTLAIRGTISNVPDSLDGKNISLFLGSNFHHVIYPLNYNRELNYIAIMKHKLSQDQQKSHALFNERSFIEKIKKKIYLNDKEFFNQVENLKIFPVFVSKNFYDFKKNNIYSIGDAFFASPPSFAQGASQSIESAYELFKSIENNDHSNFFRNRIKKIKMVSIRAKFNQFTFHLSNPLAVFVRNFFLKKLVNNKKFLDSYLGKIYRD
tara:strand:- start:1572 stop:2717 length:1146 start_codon:yes stop_codon:yes gene_type:complete